MSISTPELPQYITSQRYRPCKLWDLCSLRAYIIVWADFLTSPSTCPWKDQERHFNVFLGELIFLYFSMPLDYWKIGKNSTLYVVIWRYSQFPSFFLFFPWWRRPPAPSNDALGKDISQHRIFMESTLSMPEIDRVRSACKLCFGSPYLLTFERCKTSFELIP